MTRFAARLLTAILLLGIAPAFAADAGKVRSAPRHATAPKPPPAANGEVPAARTGPLRPPPEVRYGCRRIWRCDDQVCEWRRGCWGVYGYVEGPYYTPAFARRQWEAHGLPGSPQDRRRRQR
jgi:hypothetical protein